MLAIYEHARAYMASLGNPHQWGDSGYPSASLLREDIAWGISYVVTDHEDEVVATFVFVVRRPYLYYNRGGMAQ